MGDFNWEILQWGDQRPEELWPQCDDASDSPGLLGRGQESRPFPQTLKKQHLKSRVNHHHL